jgi:hypothetical protein
MMTDESSGNTQQHENADFKSLGNRGVRLGEQQDL